MKSKLLEYVVWIAVAAAIMALILYAPSLDRLEEAHGFLFADGIVRGNGVLVGMKVDGVDRVAFLTCKHVVTTRYLPANVAYIEQAREGYQLFLNVPGMGFRYASIANINPSRWHLSKDKDVDLAWLILTDDEIKSISGAKGLSYIEIQKETLSMDEGMLCNRDFAVAGIEPGAKVETTRILSPVKGDQRDPISCKYYAAMMKLRFSKHILAYVHQKSGTLLSIGNFVDLEAYGGEHTRPRVSTFDVSSGIGNSGSPVFAKDKNGNKKLIGLVVGTDGKVSHFQSFDFVVANLREDLLAK